MAYIKVTIEAVRSTHAKVTMNQMLPRDDAELLGRLEIEMKMLKLELLAEIAESLSKVACLGDCVTEKNQLQTNTEVWNEDDLSEKRLDALR